MQTTRHEHSAAATGAQTYRQLALALLAAGFRFGAPRSVRPDTRQIDKRLCRRMVCPRCPARGLKYIPFHKGETYRVLARCERCHGAEQV